MEEEKRRAGFDVSQEDVPMPYNERLEKAVLPSAKKIVAAVERVCHA